MLFLTDLFSAISEPSNSRGGGAGGGAGQAQEGGIAVERMRVEGVRRTGLFFQGRGALKKGRMNASGEEEGTNRGAEGLVRTAKLDAKGVIVRR